MLTKILYGGKSDVGYQREINEDYVGAAELGDDAILAIIADGSGSKASSLQPASIAAREVTDAVKRIYEKDGPEFLFENAEPVLRESMHFAGRVLGAFKAGNDELYSGFFSSMSCVLLQNEGGIALAHAGNTRIYIVRSGSIRQLTKDHTQAEKLMDDGAISELDYYSHPGNIVMTSGLGVLTDPVIQTYAGRIKSGDMILMTTDGIHYAVRPEPMVDIIMAAGNCDDAAQSLIQAGVSQKRPDNMAAMLLVYDIGGARK